jgi:ATP-binding cassette subfamily B protein
MITHRLNILADFDRIIVLDDGKIVEEGTHQDLIRSGGYYSEIFEQQQVQEQSG